MAKKYPWPQSALHFVCVVFICRDGEIGRRTCLRSKREQSHGSSSLPPGTMARKKQNHKEGEMKSIVDFIYEVGILSKTPRSGLWFLGTGNQSVAEHLLRTAYITYSLCHLTPKANRERAILMALLHDLGEARTSDLNYVHQKYGRLAEDTAISDIARTVPFGGEIQKLYLEEKAKE